MKPNTQIICSIKSIYFIILIFNIFNINVYAQEVIEPTYPKFTFGAEWGCQATFFEGYDFNYFVPEGYRVDEEGINLRFNNNADMYFHVGYNINERMNISLYMGYAGLGDIHNAIPVSIRFTRYFGKDHMKDRWFAFGDIGSGISIKIPVQEIAAGKIGAGYRISLSRDTKLDFHASVRASYTHPEIIYDGTLIPNDRINRNNAYLCAISLGMAVVF